MSASRAGVRVSATRTVTSAVAAARTPICTSTGMPETASAVSAITTVVPAVIASAELTVETPGDPGTTLSRYGLEEFLVAKSLQL